MLLEEEGEDVGQCKGSETIQEVQQKEVKCRVHVSIVIGASAEEDNQRAEDGEAVEQ